jgi:hypothetical protein
MNSREYSPDNLFIGRTSEAAARQCAAVLAWATEVELATLEYYETLSRPPKHELERHRNISDRLVYHCRDLRVPPYGLMGHECPRLKMRLEEDTSAD